MTSFLARAAAVVLLALAGVCACAETTLTYEWTNITCGIVAADGSRTEQPCASTSFAAMVEPGQSVFVSASLSYTYSDDGLPLQQPVGFQTDAFGGARPLDHESAGIYVVSNLCQGRLCTLQPDRIDSFGGPNALILGDNLVRDELTGEQTFFASSGVPSTWLQGGAQRGAFLNVVAAITFSGVPPVPEPGTYALMLAGLVMLGVTARPRGGG